ncbi:AN1-type zinc finger protein 2A isoform X1 [Cavia porcellus]|uniref:AN1-type zinc finger protein 2A isoform X1 n=1 Tax=Cavia porcellus TaxID=10141 RepID=UPI002FDF6923
MKYTRFQSFHKVQRMWVTDSEDIVEASYKSLFQQGLDGAPLSSTVYWAPHGPRMISTRDASTLLTSSLCRDALVPGFIHLRGTHSHVHHTEYDHLPRIWDMQRDSGHIHIFPGVLMHWRRSAPRVSAHSLVLRAPHLAELGITGVHSSTIFRSGEEGDESWGDAAHVVNLEISSGGFSGNILKTPGHILFGTLGCASERKAGALVQHIDKVSRTYRLCSHHDAFALICQDTGGCSSPLGLYRTMQLPEMVNLYVFVGVGGRVYVCASGGILGVLHIPCRQFYACMGDSGNCRLYLHHYCRGLLMCVIITTGMWLCSPPHIRGCLQF